MVQEFKHVMVAYKKMDREQKGYLVQKDLENYIVKHIYRIKSSTK
jgi:hypothetical protein